MSVKVLVYYAYFFGELMLAVFVYFTSGGVVYRLMTYATNTVPCLLGVKRA